MGKITIKLPGFPPYRTPGPYLEFKNTSALVNFISNFLYRSWYRSNNLNKTNFFTFKWSLMLLGSLFSISGSMPHAAIGPDAILIPYRADRCTGEYVSDGFGIPTTPW